MQHDKTAVIPKANISKYGRKAFMHDGPWICTSLPNELRKS